MKSRIIERLLTYRRLGIMPNFSEMSRESGLSRQTLRKYYENGGIPKRRKRIYISTVDPYHDIIADKLTDPEVTIEALRHYLSNVHGFTVNYNTLKAYVWRSKLRKPGPAARPHVRFETEPGWQLQVDWKEEICLHSIEGNAIVFNIYSATLGYSRYHIFILSFEKDENAFFRCTNMALRMLGGSPHEILTDNMSAIVSIGSDGRRRMHQPVMQYERDSGIGIRLCKVRSPQTKGKVESSNRFVDWLRPYDGEVRDVGHLNEIIVRMMNEANEKVNAETGIPPAALFRKEKEHLAPLPNMRVLEGYELGMRTVTVPPTMLVYHRGKRYSVSKDLIGHQVQLMESGETLYIYYNGEAIRKYETNGSGRINYSRSDYAGALGESAGGLSSDAIEEIAARNLGRF